MIEDKIQQNINQIEAIYVNFRRQLQQLKAEQDIIIKDFLKTLEVAKIEELRKSLGISNK
jgi:hypothetical protein